MSNPIDQYRAPYGELQAECEMYSRCLAIFAQAKKKGIYPDRIISLKNIALSPISFPSAVVMSLYNRLIVRIIEIGKTCFSNIDNKGGRLGYHLICLISLAPLGILFDIVATIIGLAGTILGLCIPFLTLSAEELMAKGFYLDKTLELNLLKAMVPSPLASKNPTPHPIVCVPFQTFVSKSIPESFSGNSPLAIELWQKMAENEESIKQSKERLIPKVCHLFERLAAADPKILNAIAAEAHAPAAEAHASIFEEVGLSIEKDHNFCIFLQTISEHDRLDSNYLKNKLEDLFKLSSNNEIVQFSKTLIKVFLYSEKNNQTHSGIVYSEADKLSIPKIEQEFPIVYGIGMLIY